MGIVEMSLTASLLIVVIVIVRALALYKLPKKTFLILWGVVVCRLLIPFKAPASISLYTGVEKLKDRLSLSSPASLPAEGIQPIKAGFRAGFQPPSASDLVGSPAPDSSQSPMVLIWLVGVCACAIFFLVAYIKCRREYQTSLPVEDAFADRWLREHPLRRPVQIRQSDRIKAPLTYGVFHPVILMPKNTNWADEEKLRYILMHEFVHIRNFDTLKKLLLTTAGCVHWFNPFVWMMVGLANRDIEHSCDEAVVRSFGQTMKSFYATVLVNMEEAKSGPSPLSSHFSKNAIEERIVSIMKGKKPSLPGILLALTLAVGIPAIFATSAASATPQEQQGQREKTQAGLDQATVPKAEPSVASAALFSYTDKTDGKTYYSWDEGKTWAALTDEEFAAKYPTPDVVWWTYEDYKAWLDQEKEALKNIIGEKGWNPTDGWYVWTQERVDEAIKLYEQQLQEIREGKKISKTVDGGDDITLSYDEGNVEVGASYGLIVTLDNGEQKDLGHYLTKEELRKAAESFCKELVAAGKMTQQDADKIMKGLQ
ncbi:M56 family metallopeptidase [Gorillibacterium sp. CAU 1737]|uniref:M56 family metallopeptidase n=1 Tax=Gorillibacterium sp. CAU 1737 TaxID=3140362 RepID=UPI003260ABA8